MIGKMPGRSKRANTFLKESAMNIEDMYHRVRMQGSLDVGDCHTILRRVENLEAEVGKLKSELDEMHTRAVNAESASYSVSC